jgi:hypothetical protein
MTCNHLQEIEKRLTFMETIRPFIVDLVPVIIELASRSLHAVVGTSLAQADRNYRRRLDAQFGVTNNSAASVTKLSLSRALAVTYGSVPVAVDQDPEHPPSAPTTLPSCRSLQGVLVVGSASNSGQRVWTRFDDVGMTLSVAVTHWVVSSCTAALFTDGEDYGKGRGRRQYAAGNTGKW